MVALNTGFFNRKADLNIIKKPSIVGIMGNQDEETILKLQTQLEKLQQKKGTEQDQQAINGILQSLAARDTIQTKDKDFIGKLMDIFNNKKATVDNGYIMKPKSGMLYVFQFGYGINLPQDTNEDMANNLKSGYIPDFYLFPNNLLLLPFYDKEGESSISTVELRIDDATVKYLVDFYNSQMKVKQ